MRSWKRTLRIVPADLRERYAQEWAADLAGAAELGMDPAELQRGFRAAARQLRRRRILAALQGRRGAGALIVAWGAPLLICAAIFPLLALPVPLVATAFIIAGARHNRALLAGLSGAGAVAFGYVAAAWLVGFDYADAGLPSPPWTKGILPALGLGVLATIGLIAVALIMAHEDQTGGDGSAAA